MFAKGRPLRAASAWVTSGGRPATSGLTQTGDILAAAALPGSGPRRGAVSQMGHEQKLPQWKSSEASSVGISRRNGDFANKPFRSPIKVHFPTKWADASFDEATTEALAFGRTYFRTAQFGPAEH